MRLKKLGAALIALAALGAVLASSALAAAVTEDVSWYVGSGTGTTISAKTAVNASLVTAATFTTTIGTPPVKVVLEAEELECKECFIEDVGGVAVGNGKLVFKKVKVEEPKTCSVASTIETNALSVQADWMISSTNYVKFVPTAGEEKGFATVTLTGASCPITTSIIPKGSVFVETVNATGTLAASQQVRSSGTINSTAGGTLHVGTEAATLEGTAAFSLADGEAFGTHK